MPWWGAAWIVLIVIVEVAANVDDVRDGIALWKVGLDIAVALLTSSCILLYLWPCAPDPSCRVVISIVATCAAWSAWRAFEDYRSLVRTGEIASRGDQVAAIVVTVLLLALFAPAWVLGCLAVCAGHPSACT